LVLAPLGCAPVGAEAAATPQERYLSLWDAAPGLVAEQLINGMHVHVHVQVPDRASGVTVVNRLRPWLHVLLALAANSPVWPAQAAGVAEPRVRSGVAAALAAGSGAGCQRAALARGGLPALLELLQQPPAA
jgi:hypothetical protein